MPVNRNLPLSFSAMNTFSKLSLLVLGLATAALPAFSAEGDAPAAPRPERPLLRALAARRAVQARVLKRLDLTAEQKTQLKAQRDATASALKAIRADQSLTQEQKKAKAREAVQSARVQMRSLLTKDQQAKLDKMRERLRAARSGAGSR